MKRTPLIALLGILLFGCGGETKKDNSTEENAPLETIRTESTDKSSQLITQYADQIKETAFFTLRQKEDINEEMYIKWESIDLSGDQLRYVIVTQPDIPLYDEEIPQNTDDTVRYTGRLTAIPNAQEINASFIVQFASNRYNSAITNSPYNPPKREQKNYEHNIELVIDPASGVLYNKNNLYLKARIFTLSKEDLSDFSKEELPYFRNELFARHGHTFKTDKMSSYFAEQPWYQPFVDDATDHLNDIEKKNAQFVKSLE